MQWVGRGLVRRTRQGTKQALQNVRRSPAGPQQPSVSVHRLVARRQPHAPAFGQHGRLADQPWCRAVAGALQPWTGGGVVDLHHREAFALGQLDHQIDIRRVAGDLPPGRAAADQDLLDLSAAQTGRKSRPKRGLCAGFEPIGCQMVGPTAGVIPGLEMGVPHPQRNGRGVGDPGDLHGGFRSVTPRRVTVGGTHSGIATRSGRGHGHRLQAKVAGANPIGAVAMDGQACLLIDRIGQPGQADRAPVSHLFLARGDDLERFFQRTRQEQLPGLFAARLGGRCRRGFSLEAQGRSFRPGDVQPKLRSNVLGREKAHTQAIHRASPGSDLQQIFFTQSCPLDRGYRLRAGLIAALFFAQHHFPGVSPGGIFEQQSCGRFSKQGLFSGSELFGLKQLQRLGRYQFQLIGRGRMHRHQMPPAAVFRKAQRHQVGQAHRARQRPLQAARGDHDPQRTSGRKGTGEAKTQMPATQRISFQRPVVENLRRDGLDGLNQPLGPQFGLKRADRRTRGLQLGHHLCRAFFFAHFHAGGALDLSDCLLLAHLQFNAGIRGEILELQRFSAGRRAQGSDCRLATFRQSYPLHGQGGNHPHRRLTFLPGELFDANPGQAPGLFQLQRCRRPHPQHRRRLLPGLGQLDQGPSPPVCAGQTGPAGGLIGRRDPHQFHGTFPAQHETLDWFLEYLHPQVRSHQQSVPGNLVHRRFPH